MTSRSSMKFERGVLCEKSAVTKKGFLVDKRTPTLPRVAVIQGYRYLSKSENRFLCQSDRIRIEDTLLSSTCARTPGVLPTGQGVGRVTHVVAMLPGMVPP